jgi:ABC-type transporter Mla MlaB component
MAALEITELSWPDGNVALVVAGVVTDDTAAAFASALDAAIGIGVRQPLIDLTSCQLDSPGLAALIRLQHRSSCQRGATPLVAPTPDSRLRRVVALTTMFRLYPTLDAALHSTGSVFRVSQGCQAARFSPPMQRVGMVSRRNGKPRIGTIPVDATRSPIPRVRPVGSAQARRSPEA